MSSNYSDIRGINTIWDFSLPPFHIHIYTHIPVSWKRFSKEIYSFGKLGAEKIQSKCNFVSKKLILVSWTLHYAKCRKKKEPREKEIEHSEHIRKKAGARSHTHTDRHIHIKSVTQISAWKVSDDQ